MAEVLDLRDHAVLPGPGPRHQASVLPWPGRSSGSPSSVITALERVRRAPTILGGIHAAPGVRRAVDEAVRDGHRGSGLLHLLREAIHDTRDTVTAVSAIHALALLPGEPTDVEIRLLMAVLPGAFEAHVMWSLYERAASPTLVEPLVAAVGRGGLPGMHAQVVLARWSMRDEQVQAAVLEGLRAALDETSAATSRRYLAETIGLLPGRAASLVLERLATDSSESSDVRLEAIASLADRPAECLPTSVARLATRSGWLGAAVRDARAAQRLRQRGPRQLHDRREGLKVAQVHLAATLDAEASFAGIGDAGGVATLLPSLGSGLVAQPRMQEVISIGRARPGQVARAWSRRQPPEGRERQPEGGHRFESVPLHAGEGASFSGRWPSLVAARRGIRAALLAGGTPDVIHLRMADPGSLAAAEVAAELGVATVFTLAPDPHGPLAADEMAGTIDRRSFATRDARGALWFRIALVTRLARQARELVLFPRVELRRQLLDLTGIDISAGPPRQAVVPEGVDSRLVHDAAAIVSAGRETPVLRDLRAAVAALPADRQGLPLVISVGRLSEVKGMSRVVEAMALDPALARAANLVIVGGDLAHPSAAEAAELARMHAHFEDHPGLRDRVVLLGHRRHAEAVQVMAVAQHGLGRVVAPGGAYVCGSLKEEFGLAIVEAMAAGLPVVAPRAGGPSTYVEPDVTGVLVDTADPAAIAGGMRRALHLAADPATAERARAVVESRFTVEHMARALAAVYRIAAGARTLALPVEEGRAA